ncbi:hypothetical protein DICPUDRAFT_153481 [Dictyostelium purpureum]|uniref:DDHD domain-containing protein n=1 Tax=Dictyostelium purpureum TaxID=5786 RepID=F0ZP12_DICPU|nr:uncharacterized protein DICPUDRAFT_153481 [Dictyostelium purpureum]EGC34324.1 hypothetical protein DICPUDRAFT_153481 [Dictyostelium purpureum]|eukprot:XP_003289160.1 hypothetical protein DICPUDRAFT_153481 [Dictyostelium purpureum]
MIDTSGNNSNNNNNNDNDNKNNSLNNLNNLNNNYSYNNKALKRKIEESNNNNNIDINNSIINSNEIELKEINTFKRLEVFNEYENSIVIDSSDDNISFNNSNNNSSIENNVNNKGRNEECSYDYSYNYSMNNRIISRRDSDQKDSLNDSTSSLGLGSLTMQSPQLGSPMSLSWSQFITPQPPPAYSIANNTLLDNSNNINNTANINNNTTTVTNNINNNNTTPPLKHNKSLSNSSTISNSDSSLSSSVSSKDEEELVDNTSTVSTMKSFEIDAPADPYDIDPVLKEQLLTEERLEKERKEAANPPQPEFDHLVFIIHGIGNQGSENRVQTLEQNVALLKKNCELFQKDSSNKKLNVEFQIIEWHSKLRNNDDLNNNLEKISPVGVKKIREFINETLLDVLLYMSPMYHQEILNEVSSQINDGYKGFLEKNQSFKGTCSIFAHSLGSVITWDILSNGLISFNVENVFAFGSPVGMFLTIKGTQLGSLKFSEVMPCCTKWFNIFSPTDPVAYRIEPFFDKKFLEYDPCLIEVEVEKKPLKQKLSGLFFKSTTTTTTKSADSNKTTITTTSKEETSPNTGTVQSTTTTTTTRSNSNSPTQNQEVMDLTNSDGSTGNSVNNSPTSTTQVIDLDSDDSDSPMKKKEIQMEKNIANMSRSFKVHPLEPDSPSLFKDSDSDSYDDSLMNTSAGKANGSESSFKSKFLMTISNVQKSMQKVNGGSNRSSLKEELKLKDTNSTNTVSKDGTITEKSTSTTAVTTATTPAKPMVREILTLSLTKDSDSYFDKYENRYDFNIEETSSFLPYYISSIYAHIEYWGSKSCAMFIAKKLLHTKNKLSSKPSSPTNL